MRGWFQIIISINALTQGISHPQGYSRSIIDPYIESNHSIQRNLNESLEGFKLGKDIQYETGQNAEPNLKYEHQHHRNTKLKVDEYKKIKPFLIPEIKELKSKLAVKKERADDVGDEIIRARFNSEFLGGKRPLKIDLSTIQTSEDRLEDYYDWYAVRTRSEAFHWYTHKKEGFIYTQWSSTKIHHTIGYLHNSLTLNEQVVLCAVTPVTYKHVVTSAQCCAGVGAKSGTYKIVMSAEHGKYAKYRFDSYKGYGVDYIPYYEVIQFYYHPEFSNNHLRDICVIEHEIAPNLDIDLVYNFPVLISKKKFNESIEIAHIYKNRKYTRWKTPECVLYTYLYQYQQGAILIIVFPITSKECKNTYGLFPLVDQFCAKIFINEPNIPVASHPIFAKGGAVVCNSELIGIVSNIQSIFDTFPYRTDSVVLITRFDYHQDFVFNHVNMYRQTPAPDDAVLEERHWAGLDSDFLERDQSAWQRSYKVIQDICLVIILIILLGFVIRGLVWFLRLVYRACCHYDREERKIKKVTGQPKKIYFRIIPAFYSVVVVVLMYVFEKHMVLPPPRRRRIARRRIQQA